MIIFFNVINVGHGSTTSMECFFFMVKHYLSVKAKIFYISFFSLKLHSGSASASTTHRVPLKHFRHKRDLNRAQRLIFNNMSNHSQVCNARNQSAGVVYSD